MMLACPGSVGISTALKNLVHRTISGHRVMLDKKANHQRALHSSCHECARPVAPPTIDCSMATGAALQNETDWLHHGHRIHCHNIIVWKQRCMKTKKVGGACGVPLCDPQNEGVDILPNICALE